MYLNNYNSMTTYLLNNSVHFMVRNEYLTWIHKYTLTLISIWFEKIKVWIIFFVSDNYYL